jgi:glycosyltransferase involved in cell wall biosynthesis
MAKRDKKLRVLMLTHIYSDVVSGGETKAAWEMINALTKKDVKIYVVTLFFKTNQQKLNPNIKVYCLPFSRQTRSFDKLGMFKTFFYAIPIIFFKKIDVIHLINTQGPHPFAYWKIKPFVSTVDLQWDYSNLRFKEELSYDRSLKVEEFGLSEQKPILLDRILGRLAIWFFNFFGLNEQLPKSVDLCAYRHKKLYHQLKEKGYQCQFVYIPVGVDTNKFKPKQKITDKNNYILFLFTGTISKRKGVEYLIRAFNIIGREYRNTELILIGPGANQTVNFFKSMVEFSNRVKFMGELPTEQVIKYTNKADVFVSSMIGLELGINKSVIEAMACGKPIIVNKAHDSEKLDGKVGFCVEPGKVSSLVEAMEKFVKNPTLIKIMGEKARKFAVKNHDWSVLAERLKNSYIRLIS